MELFYIPPTMIWPLAACLVLTGIHVYLGVHVIARKVIFVDLALAQIAALGTVIGVMLGYEVSNDATALYLYSLAFTIFGAFIFSVTRMRGEKVPHEALIGIVYAVTFATTILVLSRSALGPQELDHILKGELLWVQPDFVIKTALIYAAVGLFHFLFRKKFMALSFEPEKSVEGGMNRLWDFLFYMSFGFVITSSVAIAGVFLVFSYLVIPAVGAMLLSDKLSTRLAIGWIGGSVISFIGVKLSWDTGFPTSPLIVCVLAVALVLSALYRYMKFAPMKVVAVRNIAASTTVVAIFIAGVLFFQKPAEHPLDHALHLLESRLSTDRITAINQLAAFPDEKDRWTPAAAQLLEDEDAEVRRSAVEVLGKIGAKEFLSEIAKLLNDRSDAVQAVVIDVLKRLGDRRIAAQFIDAAENEQDTEMKIAMLEASLELGGPEAVPLLAGIMESNVIFGDEAYHALRAHVRFEFRKDEIHKLRAWWDRNRGKIKWDEKTKMFGVKSS